MLAEDTCGTKLQALFQFQSILGPAAFCESVRYASPVAKVEDRLTSVERQMKDDTLAHQLPSGYIEAGCLFQDDCIKFTGALALLT